MKSTQLIKTPKLLHVIIMSRTRFRVNLYSIVVWMSRNSLFETGAISQVSVTATGLEPTTTSFVNKHSTISPNWMSLCCLHWKLWTDFKPWSCVSIVNFEQANTDWVTLVTKRHTIQLRIFLKCSLFLSCKVIHGQLVYFAAMNSVL